MSHLCAVVSWLVIISYSEALRYGSRATSLHFPPVAEEAYLGKGFHSITRKEGSVDDATGGRILSRTRRSAVGHHQTFPNLTTKVGLVLAAPETQRHLASFVRTWLMQTIRSWHQTLVQLHILARPRTKFPNKSFCFPVLSPICGQLVASLS